MINLNKNNRQVKILGNLSITQKLVVAFGLIFIFIASFGLYILFAFNALSSDRTNVRDWLDSTIVVQKIARDIDDVQQAIHIRAATAGTPVEGQWKTRQIDIIQALDNRFTRYQQILNETTYEDESERQHDLAILNNELQVWQNYKSQVESIEPFILANNRAQIDSILNNEIENAFAKLNEAMNADAEECEKGITQAADESEQTFVDFESFIHVLGIIVAAILAFVVIILYFLVNNIRNSVTQIVEVTELAAHGDLTHTVFSNSTDEFGTIAGQFNEMMKNMRRALGKVQTAAQQVSDSAGKVKSSADQSEQLIANVASSVTDAAEHTADQKSALHETEERVKEIEHSIEASIRAMKSGLESVQRTADYASQGNETANLTVHQINEISVSLKDAGKIVHELGENSKQIGSIVEAISSIAEQTNLLALNAAIEAARAGEAGRGFAVVADEVRKLAEESQNSVQKIGDIVGKIQETTERAVFTMQSSLEKVESGRENVEATGKSFHEIVSMIQTAEENSRQVMQTIDSLRAPVADIVNRAERMSTMSADISSKMESISIATADQAAKVVEISDSSGSLSDLSQNLKNTVHEFKL